MIITLNKGHQSRQQTVARGVQEPQDQISEQLLLKNALDVCTPTVVITFGHRITKITNNVRSKSDYVLRE